MGWGGCHSRQSACIGIWEALHIKEKYSVTAAYKYHLQHQENQIRKDMQRI